MKMARAAESTHWYDRDGSPMYEVVARDGTMRPATLRDARKFGWYPGVTSIIRCAAAPGLELWKQNQVLLAALTLPRGAGENDESFCKRVISDSGEQARKARDRGTEIHAAIQGHYEGKPPSIDMHPYVRGVAAVIQQNFAGAEWVAERPCANPLGYGTKADLSSVDIVLDFKGADFDAAQAATLKTWDEHAMQLAATREALRMPGAECAIVYVSRVTPGLCRVIRVDEPELCRGWEMFRGLLTYWQAKADYWPAAWKPDVKAA
jgi:hypothetical protein